MAATLNDAIAGWEIFKGADGRLTRSILNEGLRSLGKHEISARTFTHYKQLRRSGHNEYVSINHTVGVGLGIRRRHRVAGVAGLAQLVEAIATAAPEDEDEYIEWKSNLDLSSKRDTFNIARSILGFANRDPSVAARYFEGCAYLVVGVEPGASPGVDRLDPADLTPMIDRYVGGPDGPTWEPSYVEYNDVSVLVIRIEPPRYGDPGWPLHKEYDGKGAGTLFVRRRGSTDPAGPPEIRMLFLRAASEEEPSFELLCNLHPNQDLSTFDGDAWMESQRTALHQRINRMKQSAARINEYSIQRTISDRRGIKDYYEQVDRFAVNYLEWVEAAWTNAAWESLPEFVFEIVNPTDTYLTGIRAEIRFSDDSIFCLLDEPTGSAPPIAPTEFGRSIPQRPLLPDLTLPAAGMSSLVPSAHHPIRTSIPAHGGIVIEADRLHPQGSVQSDPVRIVVPADIANEAMRVFGTATAEGHHRVIQLALDVGVKVLPLRERG